MATKRPIRFASVDPTITEFLYDMDEEFFPPSPTSSSSDSFVCPLDGNTIIFATMIFFCLYYLLLKSMFQSNTNYL